jgi:uncharacterized membrane protein (GlpM family)
MYKFKVQDLTPKTKDDPKDKMANDIITRTLSKESYNYIKKISCIWMLISCSVFFITHYLGIDKESCEVCYTISSSLWFIENVASASKFSNAIRLQWLFLLFSMPVFIVLSIYKINDLKHGDMPLRLPVAFGMVSLIGTFVFLFVDIHGDTSFGPSYLLLNMNIFWSSFLSYVCFLANSLGLVFIGLYLKCYMKEVFNK